ncbi:prolyl oligopeptidase family serine peptidase [Spirosoma sp. RP8]|uniref:Prolyl oligopeptidase family serine peptidase n=1 Tax=Spirosoma liriopis TaxID=2937440 RepID=A0ABT0HSX8_9BACT|nr:prolyl oligopeptidase family serine peptidase [Spirosoma liriopis]MCK8495252.1 prolyl oligopeptidase family serine peptidase [Spirosoma liriopis]
MRTCLLVTLALLLYVVETSIAQPTPVGPDHQQFVPRTYVKGGDTLRYRLLYPLDYNARKKYPLLIYLHGNGERGNDNQRPLLRVPAALTSDTGRQRYPCFMLVPQCPSQQVWVDFPHFPKSLRTSDQPTRPAQLTLSLIDELIDQLAIDTDRVYITGYSSGGEGSLDLLTRRPTLFTAAIPVCSVADTARAKSIFAIPVWLFHGSADSVNRAEYSRLMVAALRQHGGSPHYTEYSGAGHNIVRQTYAEGGLFEWLFSQKKR